ncbi:hypothetical protein DFH07DRAFT_784956 [Mycena maculata]|uniref:Uncharacterized protein n=1 Tax=Mycena maculata TaxID=230809 RepID=A0AAD7HEM2_9AGAR|nr:hypothetical protein DFH07DRAFT_784956 [Mycena maculata]
MSYDANARMAYEANAGIAYGTNSGMAYDAIAGIPYPPPNSNTFPPEYTPTANLNQGYSPSASSGVNLPRDADFLIQSFLPPAPSQLPFEPPRIPLPYCVPQLAPGVDAPFARGYNRVFDSLNLPQDALLDFVDGLNLAITASTPLRVVDVAGRDLAFVPYHWETLDTSLQNEKSGPARVLPKSLTDRYLRAANTRVFHPRRLVARICTTAAMQRLVLRAPAAPAPASRYANANANMTPTQRRVAALAGHAMPLDFALPPSARARGARDTMCAWGVRFSDAWAADAMPDQYAPQFAQQQQRGLPLGDGLIGRGVGLLGGRGGGGLGGRFGAGGERYGPGYGSADEYAYDDGRYDGHERDKKDRKRERRRSHDGPIRALLGMVGERMASSQGQAGRGVAGGYGGGGRDRDGGRRGGLVTGLIGFAGQSMSRAPSSSSSSAPGYPARGDPRYNTEVTPYGAPEQVLWLVVMRAEMDREIAGIEGAESRANEEVVDERTWEAEVGMGMGGQGASYQRQY